MKGKFDAYVLCPLAKKFQNWIVDRTEVHFASSKSTGKEIGKTHLCGLWCGWGTARFCLYLISLNTGLLFAVYCRVEDPILHKVSLGLDLVFFAEKSLKLQNCDLINPILHQSITTSQIGIPKLYYIGIIRNYSGTFEKSHRPSHDFTFYLCT